MKRWHHSRTIWLNLIAGLSAAAATLGTILPEFRDTVPPKIYLPAMAILAALNIWLRMPGNEPIGKAPPAPTPEPPETPPEPPKKPEPKADPTPAPETPPRPRKRGPRPLW